MVQQLTMIVVEIAYAGAGEFGTLGAVSDLFALRTGPDVAFRAERYNFALAEASVALKILPLNFGQIRAHVLHEFFGFPIIASLGVQEHRTGATIKSAGCNQLFPVRGRLHSTSVFVFQA
jgi:hypothetical protein